MIQIKNNIKIFVSVFISLFLIFFISSKINHVLKDSGSEKKYKPFFECKTDIDVMFFGSSHILTGIYPMQLWKEFGITSYNFGNSGSKIKPSYETMTVATEYKKPKVCILDVYYANYPEGDEDSKKYYHIIFDDFPFSLKKIRAAKKVCKDNEDDFYEYLIPFSVYHRRWNEKSIDWKNLFFDIEANKEMGASTKVLLSPQKEFKPIPKDETLRKETINLEYIRKFVEYCRENQMIPILINVPWPANEEDQKGANSVYKIAEEMNVEYINFMYEDFFDVDIDCCENSDVNSHLNPSGAKKITDYLGNLLTEIGIENHSNDKNYSEWNKYHEEYKKYLIKRICVEYSFKHILLFLTSNCFRGELSVQEDFQFDSVEEKLLLQLSDRLSVKRDLPKDKNIKLSIKIYDRETGEFITEKPSKNGSTF